SSDTLETLLDGDIDAAVELTVPESTEDNVRFLVEHDIDAVAGATGRDNDRLARLLSTLAEPPQTAVPIAPTLYTAPVRANRFAELAAPCFDSAEVVETHHTRSLGAPSGTANHTAQRIAAARSSAGLPPVPDSTESDPLGARGAVIDGIRVHAIRQQGMNAHEEIHYCSDGEALTSRTDSHSTSAFMPGIVTVVRSIADYTGLIHGLENMLDL